MALGNQSHTLNIWILGMRLLEVFGNLNLESCEGLYGTFFKYETVRFKALVFEGKTMKDS